ncbi:MAG TPA: hypothetical protein VLS89_10960 [Candidatus Nanopelagicales bacterium]|nr:hypothetical protein [Candidatus Nanopelagicales bacterium]
MNDVEARKFPARGIAQVLRLLPDTVRRAHWGYFDVLVVHGDADDSPEHEQHSAHVDGCHTCLMIQRIEATLATMSPRPNQEALLWALAVPRQSTDAWLLWARDDGDPAAVEGLGRHGVKAKVFGKESYGHVAKAEPLAARLIERLQAAEVPPPSLARFLRALEAARAGLGM